jgi:hypothetical protein
MDILSVSCSILCFNKQCICWQRSFESLSYFRHYVPQLEAQLSFRRKFSIKFASRNTIALFCTSIHLVPITSSLRFSPSNWPACSKTKNQFRSTQLWTSGAHRYAIFADAIRLTYRCIKSVLCLKCERFVFASLANIFVFSVTSPVSWHVSVMSVSTQVFVAPWYLQRKI